MLTNIGWITMKFGANIHVPLRMNCSNFGDPPTLPLVPSSGQHLPLFNTFLPNTRKR